MMRMRSSLMMDIREFFNTKEFIEVDTPLLSPAILPETTIEVFATRFSNPYRYSEDLFLLPSPEYWLKKLLSLNIEKNIFQLTKAFRNSEQLSNIHNIEFTLLEWYSSGQDYRWAKGFTKQLIQHLANRYLGEIIHFNSRSVTSACREYADLDLDRCLTAAEMREEARRRGHNVSDNESWNDAFNRIFVSLVEPALNCAEPLFLVDYPKEIACLAKETEHGPYRERWELYWRGMEIANCYSEETDPERVKKYLETEGQRKKEEALIPARIDSGFWKIYQHKAPHSSGVALGFDRLLMILTGETDIKNVIYFPYTP